MPKSLASVDWAVPSKDDGVGAALDVSRACVGISMSSGDDVRSVEYDATSSLLLAELLCLVGDGGMLKLLVGLANGLVGRSDVWLIVDGRRTKGLVFSGDSEPVLTGDKLLACFVGD